MKQLDAKASAPPKTSRDVKLRDLEARLASAEAAYSEAIERKNALRASVSSVSPAQLALARHNAKRGDAESVRIADTVDDALPRADSAAYMAHLDVLRRRDDLAQFVSLHGIGR